MHEARPRPFITFWSVSWIAFWKTPLRAVSAAMSLSARQRNTRAQHCTGDAADSFDHRGLDDLADDWDS